MKLVPDQIHGLGFRPHYEPAELDREFDRVVSSFRRRQNVTEEALSTDNLTVLIEEHVEDLDLYADLTGLGTGVEGVTSFAPERRPRVLISEELSGAHRENRLRTTLAHEFGHVHLHKYIIDLAVAERRIDEGSARIACYRDTIVTAPKRDWREWQAGYACGAILMPSRKVSQLVDEWRKKWSGPLATARSALIHEVSATFEVSKLAAEVRLRVLGKVDEFNVVAA